MIKVGLLFYSLICETILVTKLVHTFCITQECFSFASFIFCTCKGVLNMQSHTGGYSTTKLTWVKEADSQHCCPSRLPGL